ncbi:MAG: hypothetical protein AAFU77_09575 [Myxococcota bacterium]
MIRSLQFILIAALFAACRSTLPASDVQLIDKGGQTVYFAGAAAPGMSKTVACEKAVNRSVRAIALRFAQEHDDEADDIAEAVGAEDGEVFMQRFAKDSALNGAVDNVDYDPRDHLCKATVRWTPPIFLKEAVMKYAEQMKEAELSGQTAATAPVQKSAPAPSTGSVAAPTPTAEPACERYRSSLARAKRGATLAAEDFDECVRRTDGDTEGCVRYKLKTEDAERDARRAQADLDACLDGA